MSGRGIIHWSGHGKLLTDRQISFVSDQKVLSDVLRTMRIMLLSVLAYLCSCNASGKGYVSFGYIRRGPGHDGHI